MKKINYEQGYFKAENKVLTSLKPHLLRTYLYINSLDFKGEGIWHSQQTLADGLRISVRSLQRHLKELSDMNFISKKRRGFNQTNIMKCLVGVIKRVKEAKEKATEQFKSQFTNTPAKSKKKLKFDNFTGREYSKEQWDKLENQLLGWE